MPLLEIRNLTVRFGGLSALSDVSFAVDQSEILGLIGPNGAGKTTCFNAISGFVRAAHGEVLFENENLLRLRPEQIARARLVRTFQKQSLFFGLSVLENVMIGQRATLRPVLWRALLDQERPSIAERTGEALRILEFLGMSALRDSIAGELAYGDQRRLAIGVALAARPRVLMLDEPAAGMNPKESDQLRELIGRIRTTGVTVVLVEHDMRVVMNLCDRIIVLDAGRKLADGVPDSIQQNPDVIRVYLGQAATNEGRAGYA